MGALRERMLRDMQLREFSASTQTLYLATLTDLAKYHHRSPSTARVSKSTCAISPGSASWRGVR